MKKYQCNDCNESFRKPQLLGAHRRIHHPAKKLGRPKGSKNGKRHHHHHDKGANGVLPIVAPRIQLNYCPNCKCPLGPVVAAISLINEHGGVS
jgi:hypothetical protein